MTVYWILIIGAAALGIPLCGMRESKPGIKTAVFCGVFAAALTVTAAVRLSVGIDYNMYAMLFYNMNFMSYEDFGHIQREMGMLFPVKIIEIFTFDYVPSFVFLSIAMYPPLLHFIRKNSDNPWISVFAFLAFGVFFNSLNFMRQFFAAIICAYAYKYAEKGNFFRFFVLVLFAACFHRSAFLVVPCYLFVYITMNWSVLVLSLLTAISAYTFSNKVLEIVTAHFYKNYNLERAGREVVNGLTYVYMAMFGVIFLLGFLFRNRIRGTAREKNILLWCSYGAFFFELIGMKHAIVSRVALLFMIPTVTLLVPKIWCAVLDLVSGIGRSTEEETEQESGQKKISGAGKAAAAVSAAVMLMLMSGLYYNLISRDYNGVMPYQTISVRGESSD